MECRMFTLLLLFVSLERCETWSGNYYLHHSTARYVWRSECNGHFLWWCTSHHSVQHFDHYDHYYACCPGWTDSGGNHVCSVAVCNPPCKNGGTCKAPDDASCSSGTGYCHCPANHCECPYQHPGVDCGSASCSHLSPCYPGTCVQTDSCYCSDGFKTTGGVKQNYCLTIDYQQNTQLQINEMRVRLSYWPRDWHQQREKYWIMADSTNLHNKMDSMWTNQRDFNRLETNCSSQFFVSNMSAKPRYISKSAFGIVHGEMEIWLSKLSPNGGRHASIKNTSLPCPIAVSDRHPQQALYNCNIIDTNFDRVLEHGDFLRVTYKTRGGGFRELTDLNTDTVYKTQTFISNHKTLSVEFKFDFHPPSHCGETVSCSRGEKMLTVPDFVKTSAVTATWNGWTDGDSGIYSYTMEVFAMTQTYPGELQIRKDNLLHPVESRRVYQSNLTSQSYIPPRPGLYSVVLGASDLANNTKYVRRLVLFDPVSHVTSDPDHDLFVSTASEAANYSYQSNISSDVVVTWEGHFRNAFVEDNGLLGKVLDFPLVPDNPRRTIVRSSPLDDHEGARTVDAVANARGIVNFKVTFKRDQDGGLKQPTIPSPSSSWTDLGLGTNFTVPDTASEGSTFTIWVKATDVLGNVKVDRTQVHFDDTPPEMERFEFSMNSAAQNVDFASKFQLTVKDSESGVAFVNWTFQRENGSIVYQEIVPGNRVQTCSHFSVCDCTPSDACFPFDQSFSFSNCHVMVEKERLDVESINVIAVVTNMAGLAITETFTITNLTALNGTQAYYPPQNIEVISITDSSVTMTWNFPPSCFRRKELWVLVNGERRAVHKDAVQFDLTGLEPETTYTVYMVTGYEGGEVSDKAPLTFTTIAAPDVSALSAGVLAGIGVGSIIVLLMCLFIVVFVLWRKGFVLQQPGRIYSHLSRVNSIYGNFTNFRSRKSRRQTMAAKKRMSAAAFPNNAYLSEEADVEQDELYLYGEMTFESRQPWQLDESSLTLVDHVTKGKFANIYKANLNKGAGGIRQIVAAKMLKPGYSEDDALKMTAKINFFATKLGDHDNVIKFLGAVMDNKHWGPVLVMEFCEEGQMDKWLVKHRGQVSEETVDTLRHFALGIANGMAYLASKQILHRRLAARNVLLTGTLKVKVAGFGPQQSGEDKNQQTRVPAKWAAPEVLQDKPPTEKSDIWSYGVVLWEIFSMGQVPYPNIHAREIGARLKGGYRMEKPEFADNVFYEAMTQCWAEEPDQRPTFSTLRTQLGHMSSASIPDVNYYDVRDMGR